VQHSGVRSFVAVQCRKHIIDSATAVDRKYPPAMFFADSKYALEYALLDIGMSGVVNRHLVREHEVGTIYLRVDVAPEPRPEEIYDTVETLCAVLLGVCVATNEILGGTPVGVVLRSMADELDFLKAARVSADVPRAS
jgi:hypothetical protein